MKQQPKILDLPLTKQWWDAWNKDKQEDYREITPYWFNRLFEKPAKDSPFYKYKGGKGDKEQFRKDFLLFIESNDIDTIDKYVIPRQFDLIRLSLGYQKNRPSMLIPFGCIVCKTGNEEWGAQKDRDYFVIMSKEYLQEIEELFCYLIES